MKDFPQFMKNPANRIDPKTQYTPGIEGYVFDGADDSQMAFWTISKDTQAATHSHPYDEYMVVVHGSYTLLINDRETRLEAGDEYAIAKGTVHGGKAVAGTRTIHFFSDRRCTRS